MKLPVAAYVGLLILGLLGLVVLLALWDAERDHKDER